MELSREDWNKILLNIKIKLDLFDITFQTWLQPLRINKIINDNIYISAADKNSAEIVAEKYYDILKNELILFTNNPYINLIIESAEFDSIDPKSDIIKPIENNYNFDTHNLNYNYIAANLNENYTFDTFVTGNNNSLASAAAKAVAKSPGQQYNPLFIYGGVGLGKTHLMQSIAHYILSKDPSKKVLYITSEFFTNDLIDAIGQSNNSSIKEFREKYRSNDVLLIDDIQFIIGKESTQEEFFHTFNTLYQNKKQIVISSDRPPKEMKTLEDRIKSRFSQGLITDIMPPDYEMRVAILKKKQEQEGIILDDNVIEYIADNITANVRELEGALTRIIAFSKIEQCEIDIDFVYEMLKDIIDKKNQNTITPQKIINVVAKNYKILPSDITGNRRTQPIVEARRISMYLIRNLMPDMKMTAIADFMGMKTHSSIVAGTNDISEQLKKEDGKFENEKLLTKTINNLIKQITELN